MAEKRRLSARERREPAAKRRVSEAAPASQSSKKKASIPTAAPSPTPAPAPEPEPEVVEKPLPTKIKDGEGLPTLSSPQSETLSDKEYQSIAESAVLLASLERSKKKWLSDGILVRYWTKPKKTKREQIEGKNPPKESMSKVGPCNIVVGPHLFDAMLYTVKDPNAPPPIQYTPPQRPMVHYGHPNNFQQYHPYPPPAPPQHARQHPPQTPPTHAPSPQPGHQPNSHPPPPPPNRTPNHPTPRPAPPPPGPGPQSAQRPSPSQQPQPPQPAKPSPDPVIQMLATRAASDPDLKALMRVVASSKASQEQLRAFQAHIDELNAIIRAREQQQQRQQQQLQQSTPGQSQASPRTPQPTPQQQAPQPQSSQRPPQSAQQSGQQAGPQPPQNPPLQQKQSTPKSQPTPSQTQDQSYPRVEVQIPSPSSSRVTPSKVPPQTPNAQKPGSTPQVKQEPGTTGQPLNVEPSPAVRPMPPPQQTPGAGPRSGPQHPSHQHQQQQPHQGHPPAIQSRPPQYGSPTPYYRPAPPPPPPRMNFKSVVFEFTSPLTPYGSSTSGHAGSGDRYLFPEHTILEWLPGGNTVLASFLLVKKVDPNLPFPIETAPDAGNTRAKGKSGSRSKKSDKKKAKDKEKEEKEEREKEKDKKEESKTAEEKDKSNAQPASTPQDPSSTEPKQPATEGDKTAGEQNQQKDQASATPSKADPGKQLAKEKSEDAKDTSYLKEYYQPVTFRIHSTNPKVLEPLNRVVKPADEVRKYMNEVMDRAERAPDGFLAYRLPREEIPEEPEVEETKKAGTPVPVSTGRKPSRGKAAVDESDAENSEFVEEPDEEGEELKDFYGAPTGLLPMAPM
ncbi:hypothetical protein N8T08_007249 [Aspergillus melleus]|uniref:Uncharacterized protein n=1 Tax=Aspergillus melleus TaxID=138277 RepID=A0ACC3AXV1_9EURO|nr:hypothetical protein N8T08_007249 [Aspergillus melleus]